MNRTVRVKGGVGKPQDFDTWSKLGVQDWMKREVLPPTYDGKGVEASWLRTSVEIRDRHDAIPS